MVTKLRALRARAGYPNGKAFSDAIGMKYDTYQSYESGKRKMSLERAAEIADRLGCTLDELAGRTPPKRKEDYLRQWLLDSYEACTVERKRRLLDYARDQAKMSEGESDD